MTGVIRVAILGTIFRDKVGFNSGLAPLEI
jgi:hypothetical protein